MLLFAKSGKDDFGHISGLCTHIKRQTLFIHASCFLEAANNIVQQGGVVVLACQQAAMFVRKRG
jgi:hypothetical protein